MDKGIEFIKGVRTRTGRQLDKTGVLETKGGEILEETRSVHLTNRMLSLTSETAFSVV